MNGARVYCDLRQLPQVARQGGYVYVIEFSDGTVKVGNSTSPRKRLEQHRMNAASFGIGFVRCWLSSEHLTFIEGEHALIAAAAQLAGIRRGREWFGDVDFDVVVAEAARLQKDVDLKDAEYAELDRGLEAQERLEWRQEQLEMQRSIVAGLGSVA